MTMIYLIRQPYQKSKVHIADGERKLSKNKEEIGTSAVGDEVLEKPT